ncbi:MAG: dihydrodipicolinate synthase family protein [Planctomycetota bacterium]
MTPLRLRGLIAAPHTPLRKDLSVDLDRIPAQVDHLLAGGVQGLYVLGSTGEGPSMTTAERRAVAEAFVRAVGGRVPVVLQVGHPAMAEAKELARHAAAIGADAFSAVFTSYFPVTGVANVAEHLAAIAGAAPELPFYAYHIPALSGFHVDGRALLDALDPLTPNLAGIKFTAPQVFEFQSCVEAYGGRLDVLYGCDEMLLAGATVGAHGAVGSTYNFAAPLYARILRAVEKGDVTTARTEQARSVEMVRVLVRHGGAPAIKATMGLCGFDCGPVRPPQRNLTPQSLDALRSDLDAIGFFDWRTA